MYSTSQRPVSVLILHPRENLILWSQTVRENQTTAINHLVREHNKTSQTSKIIKIRTKKTKTKKPTGVLKNAMQDQKDFKKNNVRAVEEQITAARTKQHEDEEEDTGTRPAGRENKGTREKQGKKNKTSKQDNKFHCYRFRARPIEINENKQKLALTVGFTARVAHVPPVSYTHLTLPTNREV